jgi:hypothetical protein
MSLIGFRRAAPVCLVILIAFSALNVFTPAVAADAPMAQESVALIDVRKKVKDINWEIEQAESALQQLSPPVRITDRKGTTYDADKQRQYEISRARIDRQIRDLKEDRTIWELRVSQLALAQDVLNSR